MEDEGKKQGSVRERKKQVLEDVLPLCGLGCFCVLLLWLRGHGIPCLFREVTGLLCPGCGMTHAIVAILHGNFAEAMQENALSLTVLPLLAGYLLWRTHAYLKQGREGFQVWELVFLLAMLIAVLAYGILRDIGLYRAGALEQSLFCRLFSAASEFLGRGV